MEKIEKVIVGTVGILTGGSVALMTGVVYVNYAENREARVAKNHMSSTEQHYDFLTIEFQTPADRRQMIQLRILAVILLVIWLIRKVSQDDPETEKRRQQIGDCPSNSPLFKKEEV
ncbi:MAG TPA: hypothetical protein VK338_00950 [Candidatus Nitrosocosmicus sp.]|nr:hypothetical protein [Candidatus Nitrosocosmicus sp.]